MTTILGTQPPTDLAIPVGTPEQELPAQGWDVLRERFWVPWTPFFTKGDQRFLADSMGTWFVQEERVITTAAGRPLVEVTSLGLAAARGYKTALQEGSILEVNTADLASAAASEVWWKQDHPRVLVWWFSLDRPVANTFAGKALVPPETYGLPASAWQKIATTYGGVYTIYRGKGWLGETRQCDSLVACNATAIQDTYLYDLDLERDFQ